MNASGGSFSHTDVISQFRDGMRGAGLNTADHIIADGELHRFHVKVDRRSTRSGWYKLYADDREARAFGSHKAMGAESVKWTARGLERLSVEARRELMAKMEADTEHRQVWKDDGDGQWLTHCPQPRGLGEIKLVAVGWVNSEIQRCIREGRPNAKWNAEWRQVQQS